ncbi:capsular polysaccharide biosynthesis protein [Arthrobacter sp. CAN_A6]|uniref:hypothetical protein n=1 Tax=Arthrobacter sp. CAN_A6 TaxID=2787721 RepID=UPI0018CADE9B
MWSDPSARSAFLTRSITRRWRILVAALLLGALAAGTYTALREDTYSSTSIVFLEPLAGNPYSPATPSSRPEQLAALTTEAGLVYTGAVIDIAQGLAAAEDRTQGEDMRNGIVTQVPSNSQVVHITYTAPTPELAQAGSQDLAEAYLQYRGDRATRVTEAQTDLRSQQQESITTLIEQAYTRLAVIRDNPDATTEVLDLEQRVALYANQLAQVKLDQAGADATSNLPGDIISPAGFPTEQNGVSPVVVVPAILGLFLILGLILALTREHLDARIRDTADVAAAGAHPALGSVPSWHPMAEDPAREDYRRLKNMLQRSLTQPGGVVLVGGVSPRTATWQVAAGLAEAVEEAGMPAVLVIAAEHASGAAGKTPAGLTDILRGDHPLPAAGQLLRPVTDHLSVLGLGTSPTRFPALAQTPAFASLLEQLAAGGRLVLVAGPDVHSAGGAALARLSSEVLLVIPENTTESTIVASALALLDQEHATLAGAVLLRRPQRSQTGSSPAWSDGAPVFTATRGDVRAARRADPVDDTRLADSSRA